MIAASADGRVGAHLTLGDGTDEAVEGCHSYAVKHGGLSALRAASTVAHNPCVTLSTFDLTTGARLMAPVMLPTQMGGLALSPDGRTVAVVEGHETGDVVLFDVHGKVLAHLPGPPLTQGGAGLVRRRDRLRPGRDAVRRLVVGSSYVASTAAPDGCCARYRGSPWSSDVALDAGSDGLLVTIGEQHIEAIDVRTGARRWSSSIEGNRRSPCAWPVVSQAADRIYCGTYHGSIVERVRSTGQVTGRVLQTQRGNVGTLQVSADGRELVDFGATLQASIERWRIDGAGAVATLYAPGKILMSGYGPSGDALLVAPRPPGGDWSRATFGPSSVWQTASGHGSDRALQALPSGADGLLVRAGTLVAGPGDRVPPARPAHRHHAAPSPRSAPERASSARLSDGRLVLVGYEHRLEAVDPAADEVVGKPLPGAGLHLRGDRDGRPVPRRRHVLPDRLRQGRRHRRVRRPHRQAHREAADRLADLGHGRGRRRARRRPARACVRRPDDDSADRARRASRPSRPDCSSRATAAACWRPRGPGPSRSTTRARGCASEIRSR